MKQGQILVAETADTYVLKLVGDVRLTLSTTLESCIQKMLNAGNYERVVVDLTETIGVDSTTLGLLAKLSLQVQSLMDDVPVLVWGSPDIHRLLLSMGFADSVFHLVDRNDICEVVNAEPVTEVIGDENEVRTRVLEAHRVLMSLNDSNEQAFRDLVCALEQGNC